MAMDISCTFIHKFIEVSTAADTSLFPSIECCGDVLSYRQLLLLSHQLAERFRRQFGKKPTIAIVSENHPYIIAVILATWLLGGVAAPLDVHAPESLLRGMLEGVKPACVVLPETSEVNLALVKDMGLAVHLFVPSQSGIPHLVKQFLDDSSAPSGSLADRLPEPSNDALYLYTSSASSVQNLKCVPVTHGSLYSNCLVKMEKFQSGRPSAARLRILGWGPMSHIVALAHDLCASTILNAGCYVFGIPPSFYPADDSWFRPDDGQAYDVGAILLQTAARAKTSSFSCVPWILRRFMEVCQRQPKYLSVLRGFEQIHCGGAMVDDDIIEWAVKNGLRLDIGMGMTELSGALFQTSATDATAGFPISSCLVAEANLSLINDSGAESESFGELVISSPYINRGYINFKSNMHLTNSAGITTFRTGDLYSLSDGYFTWQGRREDYVQLLSGELLDPRGPERELSVSPHIARVCFVGNNFLRGAADFVCALVEVPTSGFRPLEIMRAFAEVNKTLHPPLRVPWARVLVLKDGESIPMTRKRTIWRKALEEKFGDRLTLLLKNPKLSRFHEKEEEDFNRQAHTIEDIEADVVSIVSDTLGLSKEQMIDYSEATFAELGMDSNMATRIVSTLNTRFGLKLPMNTCHDHVDLLQLTNAVYIHLKQHKVSSILLKPRPIKSLDEIVIVGQSLRLPGETNDANSFWTALVDRRIDLLETITNDRWDHSSFYASPGSEVSPGSYNITKTGRIDVTSYDNAFFGISPAEAYYVSPTSRIALEVAIEALENANIPLSDIKGKKAGVFVAVGPESGYSSLVFEDQGHNGYNRYYGSGISDSTVSGRLSYFLDIHGPCVSIDTACSGGMVAFDSAVRSIRDGSSELAIVCSVSVHVWPGNFSFLSANKMSSIAGRCATFTKDADGYAPSDGAAAFIVKRKSAALRDGDNILGVIKSTGVQHNGRSQGLAAPSSKAQAELQRTLLSDADYRSSDIDFVEAHGTGTVLGDMLEIQALNEVFGGSHTADFPLVLGAAKTVFGHTESTAGLVGIAKVIQSINYGLVPGLAHLNHGNVNPQLDTSICPLKIPYYPTPLPRRVVNGSTTPYRALVMAYGFAGTISGTILEEYRKEDDVAPMQKSVKRPQNIVKRPVPHLFVISAKSEKALFAYIGEYITYFSQVRDSDLESICYTSCIGREHYRFRFACVCTTLKELIEHLEGVLSLRTPITAIVPKARVAFAFPGQGSQWQGMGRALADVDDHFRSYLMNYTKQAGDLLKVDLMSLLFEPKDNDDTDKTSSIDETHLSQVCIFTFQCAMVQWLDYIGIRPSAVLTHSLGEIAAAVATKALDFRTALEFVVVRANAMRPELMKGGLMAAVRAPVELIMKEVEELGLETFVTIAAYNAETQQVVSGDAESVRKLVDGLSAKEIKSTVLPVNQGFHSHCVDAALGPIRECLERRGDKLGPPILPYYSSVEGCVLKVGKPLDTEYWVKQARQPVLFLNAALAMLCEANLQVVLDVGPQNVITYLLKDASTHHTATDIAISSFCGRPTKDSLSPLVQTMATLFVLGITPDFQKFYSGRYMRTKKIAIPTYPWQRQRHYPTVIPSKSSVLVDASQRNMFSKTWEISKEFYSLLENNHALGGGGVPIIPTAALVVFLLQAKTQLNSYSIDLRIEKPMLLGIPGEDLLRADIRGSSFSCTHIQGVAEKGIICSGLLRPGLLTLPVPKIINDGYPSAILAKAQIYNILKSSLVKFGPEFENIQKVELFDCSAVGHIEVPAIGRPQEDFMRKLDACFHLFAIVTPEPPQELSGTGSFLPSSLNCFTLYSDSLPDSFECIYHLPAKVSSNFKKMTAMFEMRSSTGTLLASCEEYSVAWIPSALPFPQTNNVIINDKIPLLRTAWIERPLNTIVEHPIPRASSEIIYMGSGGVRNALSDHASLNSLNLRTMDGVNSFFNNTYCEACTASQLDSNDFQHNRWCAKSSTSHYIVFDATAFNETSFTESTMMSASMTALDFIKAVAPRLRSSKIASVLILTQDSLPIPPETPSLGTTRGHKVLSSTCLLGSFIQGMTRVLRQEASSQLVFALDIPISISPVQACNLVLSEFNNPANGKTSPIAYRQTADNKLIRLVSCLTEYGHWMPSLKGAPATKLRKCVVIVGLGDIGSALAKQIVAEGRFSITFIGRRSKENAEIASILRSLESEEVEIRYIQADITSLSSTRSALKTVIDEFGSIHSIVHTASIVRDSLIGNTSHADFGSVLRPKALGAWNLHLVCQELDIDIERFIMLSSLSVPLGNPGQVSYVAANSFLDTLAEHRSAIAASDSTAQSLSIQLGAWESRLTAGLVRSGNSDPAVMNISNAEGIPLLLSAIEKGSSFPLPTVSILAKINFGILLEKRTYMTDPYFSKLLRNTEDRFGQLPTSLKGISHNFVTEVVSASLRDVLGIAPSDENSIDSSILLHSLGVDSISFLQIRADIFKNFKVDLPMGFLGDDSLTFIADENEPAGGTGHTDCPRGHEDQFIKNTPPWAGVV
ncbi:hypothetical protein EW145_g6382 [Phellinidium pouzarii]|uniref:Carrier domain-containing protein n=1 Tax=Phellinidium pouzarii TaxID=167371 RepID=A0A4S4KXX6_9AGAM|nr:hypothetical protein EW145_g6382 [Phellinidium pouzarii]